MRSEREAGMGQIMKSLVGHFKSFEFILSLMVWQIIFFKYSHGISQPTCSPVIRSCHSHLKKWSLFFHFLATRQVLWLFWPIKYGRKDTVPVLGTALNWSDSFSFPPPWKPAARKKCDYSETTILWKLHATWRDREEWDAMWRQRPRSTEVPDMWLNKLYWEGFSSPSHPSQHLVEHCWTRHEFLTPKIVSKINRPF